MQLVQGNIVPPYVNRIESDEYNQALLIYEKVYSYANIPGNTYDADSYASAIGNSATVLACDVQFKTRKLVTPTINLYAYDGTISRVSDFNLGAAHGATGCAVSKAGENGFAGIIKSGGTDFTIGNNYWFKWTAEINL